MNSTDADWGHDEAAMNCLLQKQGWGIAAEIAIEKLGRAGDQGHFPSPESRFPHHVRMHIVRKS